jgi:hypothetical protein
VACVGLVVNPAAGRDVRRIVGGASVSDTYGKRRTAECVLAGVGLSDDPVDVVAMPDKAGIAQRAVEECDGSARVLDAPVTGTRADTQRAAAALREDVAADVVVVLGGDGTTRDVATAVGDVPVVAVSTGTNNVVPTPVEGTVAGAAAALLATGAVAVDEATDRHGMVEAVVTGASGDRTVRGLATVGVVDQAFVGTRAILDAGDVLGGVVSRASRGEIGLSGIAGAFAHLAPEQPGGVGFELDPDAERTVRAIPVPGVVDTVGVAFADRLATGESATFEAGEAVLSVDGERHVELRDATVTARPVADGPLLVDVERVFAAAPTAGV